MKTPVKIFVLNTARQAAFLFPLKTGSAKSATNTWNRQHTNKRTQSKTTRDIFRSSSQ